jgi:hypothetical protein
MAAKKRRKKAGKRPGKKTTTKKRSGKKRSGKKRSGKKRRHKATKASKRKPMFVLSSHPPEFTAEDFELFGTRVNLGTRKKKRTTKLVIGAPIGTMSDIRRKAQRTAQRAVDIIAEAIKKGPPRSQTKKRDLSKIVVAKLLQPKPDR